MNELLSGLWMSSAYHFYDIMHGELTYGPRDGPSNKPRDGLSNRPRDGPSDGPSLI